jgi:hypothetical protein
MAKDLLSQAQRDRMVARLMLGGLDEGAATKAVAVLNTPDETVPGGTALTENKEPQGVSPETQARIDRRNAQTREGKTWNTFGGVL